MTRSVTIREDLSWSVQVHGQLVERTKCSALMAIPETVNTKLAINKLLQLVDSLNVCAGHPEQQFVDFIKSHKAKIPAFNDEIFLSISMERCFRVQFVQ